MLTKTPNLQELADELVHEFTNKFPSFVVDDSEDHGNEINYFAEDGRWISIKPHQVLGVVALHGPFDAE